MKLYLSFLGKIGQESLPRKWMTSISRLSTYFTHLRGALHSLVVHLCQLDHKSPHPTGASMKPAEPMKVAFSQRTGKCSNDLLFFHSLIKVHTFKESPGNQSFHCYSLLDLLNTDSVPWSGVRGALRRLFASFFHAYCTFVFFRITGFKIHERTVLVLTNTDSGVRIQYALPSRGPEGTEILIPDHI